MALLPAVNAPLAALVGGLVLLGPLLTVIFTLATGALVGAVPEAARGGFELPAGQQALAALAAAACLAALRERRVQASDRVEVLDSEGYRCVGTLREYLTLPPGHSWLVELDWSTWRVAEAAEERDRREAAGARP